MLEARTRLSAQPLRIQSETHAGAGGKAKVLEAQTWLGAQPLRVQTAIHAGAGGEARVLRLGLGSVHSLSAFNPQPMRALEEGKGVGGSDSARCAAALRSICLLYTSPSPRDLSTSRMPSSA